ncbi:MAG: PqqD family protein, partial [Planctomycetes bacterium]|nr:PqqD family protein [Planctomycetota bacterium]
MSTLADSIVSSSSRSLAVIVRPDLKARKQRYQGRVYWVVKDPIGLQYFRFEEEEFAILQMLDGQSSLEEIAERFEAQFPPQTIRVEELQNFIGMLYRSGLILSDVPGQGV